MKFNKEWLPLEKMEFRIVTMISDKGKFKGNLSDICRYFDTQPQQKTRQQYRIAIANLVNKGLIEETENGRTRTLTTKQKPNDTLIEINDEWYQIIRAQEWKEEVSWEAVLKVLLWAITNDAEMIITNKMIEEATSLSSTVICSAKNVLAKFGAIKKERVTERIDEGMFMTLGQLITSSAFWDY